MPALDLASEPLPLWWTTDFILSSPVGTPEAAEKYGLMMGEKALGMLSKPAAAPATNAPAASFPSAGPVDISSWTRVAKDDLGLKDQPASPKFKGCLAEIYVRDAPYGGADKSSNGHRYDSIPFANGMISAGMSCQF